jgi:hypothetical protein
VPVGPYLDQDRVWPAPDGSELPLEDLTPAQRLSALISLERSAEFDRPLTRRLRELVGPDAY